MRSKSKNHERLNTLLGRDEMNLAEFPIALLTAREPETRRPVVFEGKNGRLTITGSEGEWSEGFGLPTAYDADVLLGLIQLTKRANNFTDPTVNFSRYELLKIIRWPDESKYYDRLVKSLKRWMGVTLHYDNSWWDNSKKCRVDASFHILEDVVMFDRATQASLISQGQSDFPFSTFSWNRVFFRSCQANNLKHLDLNVYFSLESAVTKQLYRFLDKRFYNSDILVFDLKDLAVAHVGLSPNYLVPKLKERLAGAIEELEQIGFIKSVSKEDRYTKISHGKWAVTFERVIAESPSIPEISSTEPSFVVQELVKRGVSSDAARVLESNHPMETCLFQIEHHDYLIETKHKDAPKGGGWFLGAIPENWTPPKKFKTKAQRQQEENAKLEKDRQQLEAKRIQKEKEAREAREQKARKATADAYLAGLNPEERQKLDHEFREQGGHGPGKIPFGDIFFRNYVIQKLGLVRESELQS